MAEELEKMGLSLNNKPSQSKPKLRPNDFNPLMGNGGGGSCGYRPSKSSNAKKGG